MSQGIFIKKTIYFKRNIHSSLGRISNKKLADEELIELYLSKHNSAYFDMLYNRYSTKVFSKCISLLKNEELAQDALQDIFIKIYLNIAKFSGKSKFSTWVYSITYNYCIDFLRKKKKEKNIFSEDIENTAEPIEEVPDKELLEMQVSRLKRVLEEIPIGDKAVLLMKYQDEMSIREISHILSKSESAIKMKIKRAKHKAQKQYKELYNE